MQWFFRMLLVAMTTVSLTTALHFDHSMAYTMCDDLHCVDPVWVKGPCLLACPQGNTCRHPRYGTVLKAGFIHDVDGQKCQCKDVFFPDWDVAHCAE